MPENCFIPAGAAWPPHRHKKHPANGPSPETPSRPPLSSPFTPVESALSTPSPSQTNTKKRKRYLHDYVRTPQAPSFTPYTLRLSTGRSQLKAFSIEDTALRPITTHPARSLQEWHHLLEDSGIALDYDAIKQFHGQCSNAVIEQSCDVVVVAPTGAGKSYLWVLPLLVEQHAISLVVTPYTSLGIEGEARMIGLGLTAVFVNANQKQDDILERAASGRYQVIFVCAEMLESPRFARVLHSDVFQSILQCIYIDEAHLVHESHEWRTAYSRLKQLRTVGKLKKVPMVAMSATLPTAYRRSLCDHVGLANEHVFINLGNFRPELSTVIVPLKYHSISSFQDLAFTLPHGTTAPDQIPITLVYCDDVDMLTRMFWWYQDRLRNFALPGTMVDLIHAGLSDMHEELAMADIRSHRARILLATEKIGAGINVPGVKRVAQYLTRNELTPSKAAQRWGRGARTKGTTSVGYLLVEPDLLDPAYDGNVDVGILMLARTRQCYQIALDSLLENPPRLDSPDSGVQRQCCSHCNPELLPPREHIWVMVDPAATNATVKSTLKPAERTAIHTRLCTCRTDQWRAEWRALWPSSGPHDILTDNDLWSVAKVADTIMTEDDLRSLTIISHWSVVAPWLVTTTQHVVQEVCRAI